MQDDKIILSANIKDTIHSKLFEISKKIEEPYETITLQNGEVSLKFE
jgi:hypothetical protein